MKLRRRRAASIERWSAASSDESLSASASNEGGRGLSERRRLSCEGARDGEEREGELSA